MKEQPKVQIGTKKKLHSHTRVTVSYGGGGSLFDVTFERRVTLIMNIKHAIYVYIMYVYLIYPTTNFGFLSQKCKGASMQCKMRILLGVRMCCGFVYEEMCVFVCFFLRLLFAMIARKMGINEARFWRKTHL